MNIMTAFVDHCRLSRAVNAIKLPANTKRVREPALLSHILMFCSPSVPDRSAIRRALTHAGWTWRVKLGKPLQDIVGPTASLWWTPPGKCRRKSQRPTCFATGGFVDSNHASTSGNPNYLHDAERRWAVVGQAPNAPSIIRTAAADIEQRASQRDQPAGERSMARTVAAFNAMFGFSLTEAQGWQFMELLKMSRSSAGNYHADDHQDAVAYAGLAGEAAAREANAQ